MACVRQLTCTQMTVFSNPTMPPLPIILDYNTALDAVRRLANAQDDDPHLKEIITKLGRRTLKLPHVGVRDGYSGGSKTYDLAFVGTRRAFATFVAPNHAGRWNPPKPGMLTVEVRLENPEDNPIPTLLKRKPKPDGDRGWHIIHLGSPTSLEELGAAIGIASEQA